MTNGIIFTQVNKENHMDRRTFIKAVPGITVLAGTLSGLAQDSGTTSSPKENTMSSTGDLQPITLPKPETDGGLSVLAALKHKEDDPQHPCARTLAADAVQSPLGGLWCEQGDGYAPRRNHGENRGLGQ
jgi:hypothetical protein